MTEVLNIEIVQEEHARDLPLPSYASTHAAGMDLYAAVQQPVKLSPGQRAFIPTGIRVAIPAGFEGQVRPRSGLALKYGIALVNSPGTIDADYRGEICVVIINLGSEEFTINRGDRIAQLVVAPVVRVSWRVVERLTDTERGEGGFGHTGVNKLA